MLKVNNYLSLHFKKSKITLYKYNSYSLIRFLKDEKCGYNAMIVCDYLEIEVYLNS